MQPKEKKGKSSKGSTGSKSSTLDLPPRDTRHRERSHEGEEVDTSKKRKEDSVVPHVDSPWRSTHTLIDSLPSPPAAIITESFDGGLSWLCKNFKFLVTLRDLQSLANEIDNLTPALDGLYISKPKHTLHLGRVVLSRSADLDL